MVFIVVFILFNILYQQSVASQAKDLTFVILSQPNTYNIQIVEDLKKNICDQALSLSLECPSIYFSHQDFPHIGDWTLIPILPKIAKNTNLSSWIIILEERTVVRLNILFETLSKYNAAKDVWVGYSLIDNTPTIIHHFDDKRIEYPHFGAGFAISKPLLQNISKTVSKHDFNDFHIDKSYEFSMFMKNNQKFLTHDDAFCPKESEQCACFPKKFKPCGSIPPLDSVYFAVKTWEKFHVDRVPIVLNTWAKYAGKIEFFSSVVDDSIPTISIGVPNTQSGHCEKTMRILKYFNELTKSDSELEWIFVADDDTILSVSRVLELLSCYNSNENVALGERYGFGVINQHGFNYLTGGSGMIFSKKLVENLINSCECPSISAPDDMIIGRCLANLEIREIHSHLFHQARPMDYNPHFLMSDQHLSFHKHWMLDPIQVYEDFFKESDEKLVELNTKTEL